MKQLIQSARTGAVSVVEVPQPGVERGCVLVRVAASLVSAGTERLASEFAGKNLLAKAFARPDLVRQVIEKAWRDGLLTTLEAVRNRLDRPSTLGYSSTGTVIAVGEHVTEFRVGERVACAGSGYAVHAEVVNVPVNLAARVPERVDSESATFATVGAIALHGLRLAEAQLGESVAVIGLGLIGLLTVQLARAAGCRVFGMDPDPKRCRLAEDLGCLRTASSNEEMVTVVSQGTGGLGTDAVIIAAATASNEPVEVAGLLARDRGRVVAVGAVGAALPRRLYYEKELDFRISRSYGPGRYDPHYEEQGHDYPLGYVRWTENRNMQAFLECLAGQQVVVQPLVTHRFPIEAAPDAYDLITGKPREPYLGVLITYPSHGCRPAATERKSSRIDLYAGAGVRTQEAAVAVGLLGAGQFATGTLLPAMKKVSGIEFVGVCSSTGLSARHGAEKFGFRYCTTDEHEIVTDPAVNTVVITTRHHLHAREVLAVLGAGKHLFCEKPLCMTESELRDVVGRYVHDDRDCARPLLMVGYNRRFAPLARRLKDAFRQVREPLAMHYRVNAGALPLDHWVHDPTQGGGRLVGEACHFVDLLTFLAGSLPVRAQVRALPNADRYRDDNLVLLLEFADQSLGAITYVANGDKRFSKERLEVFGGGIVGVLDDFRSLELLANGRRRVSRSFFSRDKGHKAEWHQFVGAVRQGGPLPIPFEELVSTSLVTLRLAEALQTGQPVSIDTEEFIASTRGMPFDPDLAT